jgi:MGT family glycosyltransferase
MARFLFATISATGHVNPGLPIARELVTRGHDVRWYTGREFQRAIEKTGARYVPMQRALDPSHREIDEIFPERGSLKGIKLIQHDLKNFFLKPIPDQLHDLEEELAREPADVLVGDNCAGVTGVLGERTGLPWAIFGISAIFLTSRDTAPFGLGLGPVSGPIGTIRNGFLNWMTQRVLFKEAQDYHAEIRADLGLQPPRWFIFDFPMDADLYLQSTVPSFEYPRGDLPSHVRFVGAFAPQPPAEWVQPAWWSELDGPRKVVLVTQGTVANDYDDLIRPTIRALAERDDLLVVVTTGGKPASEVGIDPLPSNVRVEQFVPYGHLMPKVDLMVTNGGYGSVQIALAHGVPLVALGDTEDKADIVRRIVWSGVGHGAKRKKAEEGQIKKLVDRTLGDGKAGARAKAVAREMAEYHAIRLSAQYLEEMVARGASPSPRSIRSHTHRK